jgi:UDP:flavonoid glycosyltransferase YjiC (YdhE family)
MKVTVVAIGSQGDVQPYIALGAGLKAGGYDVRLATHANFEPAAREHGLEFAAVEGNPRMILETEAGKALMETGSNIVIHVRRLKSLANEIIQQILSSIWKACQDTDAIVHSPFGFGSVYASQKLDVPSIAAYHIPFTGTDAFPNVTMPQLHLGHVYNKLSHIFFEQLIWQTFRSSLNKWVVETLSMPCPPFMGDFGTIHKRGYPIIYGFSPAVIPKPPDWGDRIYITGYWFVNRPEDWQPPADLVDFLQSGQPPVYIGFGSMNNRNPEEATEIVIKALDQCHQRGIILTGWGGFSRFALPDHIFSIESMPFDWLFPQMKILVHHGGAGTTAAGLRAGIPAVVVPFFADQPFWGDRIFRLGVGPRPIPRKKLSVEVLAKAISTAINDKGMQSRAATVGECIRAEDGTSKAVEIIDHYITDGYKIPARRR